MLRRQGLYIDAHKLVLDRSTALDVFKGAIVLLMNNANVMLILGSKNLTTESRTARLLCNFAAVQCFTGCMLALGYSSYRQYLRQWPDAPRDPEAFRNRVLATIAKPIVSAWICNFAWCFLRGIKERPASFNLIIEVFTFSSVFGNGADFLLGFSINLAIVWCIWRPINTLLDAVPQGSHSIDVLFPKLRRDVACMALVLSPLLLTLFPIADCTGKMRWATFFLVCDKRDADTVALPALPHLFTFGIGVLFAGAWDRFIARLKPVGRGGASGGLHILPMDGVRRWSAILLAVAVVLLMLFVPLGQVWLFVDLMQVNLQTPVGSLVRGYAGGPSAAWLLAAIWPSAVWAMSAGVLVSVRSGAAGYVLHWPLVALEHFGANVMYYLVVVDIFLAGMSGMTPAVKDPTSTGPGLNTTSCILCTMLLLTFARFLHFAAAESRK